MAKKDFYNSNLKFDLTYKVKHNKIPYLVTGTDYFINKIRKNHGL